MRASHLLNLFHLCSYATPTPNTQLIGTNLALPPPQSSSPFMALLPCQFLSSFRNSIILPFSYHFASFIGLVPWTTSLSNAKLECPETAILAKLQLLDLYRSLPFDYRTKGPFKFIMCMKIKCCTHWLFVCIYALLFVSSRLMRLLLRKILIPTKTWPLCFTS